jgi:hypothetical protein
MICKRLPTAYVSLGPGSILLSFFGYEFKLLIWIDHWGQTIGWLIKRALVVIGAAMWFLAGKSGDRVET